MGVSLKNKLKKKKANEREYAAELSESQRKMKRNELEKGYENVVSFTLSTVHSFICVDGKNEKSLDFEQALLQYQEEGVFINAQQVTTPKNEESKSEPQEIEKSPPAKPKKSNKKSKSTTPKAQKSELVNSAKQES